ncbi:MAG: GNAT family N-acetyltransferase [Pseudonocardiaceae bacterium]
MRPAEVCSLVQEIQQAPPYGYAPGEIRDASDWFPELIDSGGGTHVAYEDAQRPVGYAAVLPLVDYHDGIRMTAMVGVDPSETAYVAELGVGRGVRRQGLGSGLLRLAMATPCAHPHASWSAPWSATSPRSRSACAPVSTPWTALRNHVTAALVCILFAMRFSAAIRESRPPSRAAGSADDIINTARTERDAQLPCQSPA